MNFGIGFGGAPERRRGSVMEETQIRKYFLGGLTEAEHENFDRWLMTETDSVELVEEYEDRLIDDYVHGALSVEERTRFETHFLITPGRLGKLRLINSLIDESARATAEEERSWRESAWSFFPSLLQPESWAAQAAFASVAVALLLGGSWLAFRYWPSHKQDGQLQAEQTNGADQRKPEAPPAEQSARDPRLAEETQQPPQQPTVNKQEVAGLKPQPGQSPPSPTPRTPRMVAVTFLLSPGRVRDEEVINPLRIPPGTDLVQLKLELEADDYRAYRVLLRRADGEVLWQKTLRSTGNIGSPLIARIPARLLVDGEYILSLSGLNQEGAAEEVGNYYFKVEAR